MGAVRITLLTALMILAACRSEAVQGSRPGAAASSGSAPAWLASEGTELVGTQAPEWRGLVFVQGGPLSLAASLVVVGVHHPKSDLARNLERVRQTAGELGFEFPVAHDDEWATVRAYGVGSTFKRFTSVSVLVDRDGRIAWVHDGGEFHRGGGAGHEECNRAFDALANEIERRTASR